MGPYFWKKKKKKEEKKEWGRMIDSISLNIVTQDHTIKNNSFSVIITELRDKDAQ